MFVPMDVVAFIRSQWKCEDPLCAIDFPQTLWDELCERAYRDLIERCGYPKTSRFCIRLVGQSGSGKTSQLLPAVKAALEAQSQKFVSLAVRDFVPYHPNLNLIREHYDEGLVREKTNAFALTLLTLVLVRCIRGHLPILFEVTLLSPEYERFVHRCLFEEGYSCDYYCLAIDKKMSDAWIEARCRETHRVVSKRSSDFFFQTLQPVFESLQSVYIPNRVFVWDAYHTEPQQTQLSDKNLWEKMQTLAHMNAEPLSFEAALEAKKKFLCNFYREHSFVVVDKQALND